MTLAVQRPALDAIAQLAELGHLPGAELTSSRLYPDRVEVRLHDGLADFEAWRTALGIPTTAVTYHEQPGSMRLEVTGPYAGATIELTAYAPPLAAADRAPATPAPAVTR